MWTPGGGITNNLYPLDSPSDSSGPGGGGATQWARDSYLGYVAGPLNAPGLFTDIWLVVYYNYKI